MRKAVTISLLSLILLVGVLFLRFQLSNLAVLASPKKDQAIISFATSPPHITYIQSETTALSFVNADLNSAQLAQFNPAAQNIAISPAVWEATPLPSPTQIPKKIISTPKPEPTLSPATPEPKTPTPSPTAAATDTQTMPPGSLSGDKIFDLVNDYRVSKNLPALEKDDRSCQLARSRAPEIMGEVRTGTMHKGLADRRLPYWNNENIAYYDTEQETVKWWVSDTIHRKQIEGNFKYSCVACYKNACAEELTNFSLK